jgi:hypothetical protein
VSGRSAEQGDGVSERMQGIQRAAEDAADVQQVLKIEWALG